MSLKPMTAGLPIGARVQETTLDIEKVLKETLATYVNNELPTECATAWLLILLFAVSEQQGKGPFTCHLKTTIIFPQ